MYVYLLLQKFGTLFYVDFSFGDTDVLLRILQLWKNGGSEKWSVPDSEKWEETQQLPLKHEDCFPLICCCILNSWYRTWMTINKPLIVPLFSGFHFSLLDWLFREYAESAKWEWKELCKKEKEKSVIEFIQSCFASDFWVQYLACSVEAISSIITFFYSNVILYATSFFAVGE